MTAHDTDRAPGSALWQRWLLVGWGLTALMGVFMADAGAVAPGLVDATTTVLFAGSDPGAVSAGTQLAWGIGGGVCLGWAAMGALVTWHAWGQAWVWRTILMSGLAWLVTDCVASVLVGAPLNAVVNTVFFGLAFGVPLWRTRPAARARGSVERPA